MDFTKRELSKLIRCTDVYRDQCERHMRRIRRNKDLIQKNYDETPKEIIEEQGIESPDEQLAYFKEEKAIAVSLKQKLKIERDMK